MLYAEVIDPLIEQFLSLVFFHKNQNIFLIQTKISTIQNRAYVEKTDRDGTPRKYDILTLNAKDQIEEIVESEITGAERNKLFPTDLGMLVTDFLNEHFQQIMEKYKFLLEFLQKENKLYFPH